MHRRHHFVYYYMGRRHVVFRGKMIRTMRVFQWLDSNACHREVYDRF